MKGTELLRAKRLFLEASDLPATERASFLDAQQGLGPELRAWVETQLARFDSDDEVLESPAVQQFEEPDPDAIGPYRVLRRIGEGGMGVVYLAQQTEPVQRQVAVKRVKAGMDSEAMLRRFEAERHALERMDHPGVARVLDAGIDQDGRPFFAMEHVDGVSLIDYCDRERLTPEARLRLFVDICRGVQHAHQKGVLHRDLKPSNVLVATVDGRPVPKIIDFGVAKATERRLTEQTLHTQLGVMIGTPEYMSPEQSEPGAADVDTRSDVYSLGVLLYELLTGELPFAPSYLREQGLAGIQRVLQEEDPPRPSTRASTVSEHTTEQARVRRLTPHALAQRLRGDLDWITMRALQKRRDDRYESCGEFAADIERHLRDEPVLAGPPSVGYRLRKYVRRYRAQAIAIAMVSVALLLGTGVSIWFALDARALARQLDGARRDVEKEKAAVERVLERATTRIERLSARPANDPATMAQLRATVGEAYLALSHKDRALAHLGESVKLIDQVPDASAQDVYEQLRPLLLIHAAHGGESFRLGVKEKLERAAREILSGVHPELRAALEAVEQLAYDDPGTATFAHLFVTAERCLEPGDPHWIVLADRLSWRMTEGVDRIGVGKRMLAIYADQGAEPSDPGWLYARLKALQHCNYAQVARHGLAIEMASETLAALELALPRRHWFEGLVRLELGYALARCGRAREAKPELRTSLEILESHLGADNNMAMWALMSLVDCQDRLGATAETERLRIEFAQRVLGGAYVSDPEWVEVALRPDGASLAADLAALYAASSEPTQALPMLESFLDRLGEHPFASDAARAVVARCLESVGNDLSNAGAHHEPMRRLFEHVYRVQRGLGAMQVDAWWLARHCYLLGDYAAGERFAVESLSGPQAVTGVFAVANLRSVLGLCRIRLGGGEPAIAEAIAGYRGLCNTIGPTNGNAMTAFASLIDSLRLIGQRERARQLVAERLQELLQDVGSPQSFWSIAYSSMVSLGDDELADRIARAMAEHFDGDFRLSLIRARLAAIRFDRNEAVAMVEQALAAAPDSWLCNYHASWVYCRLGQAAEAEAHARRCVAKRNSASNRNAHAIRLARLGQYERALRMYEDNVVAAPDCALAQANLASARLRNEDPDGALVAAQRAFELAPRFGRSALASVRLARGEDAVELFVAEAEDQDRPSGSGFWIDYAEALARADRSDEARRRLERLTTEWPTEPHAWSARARALCTMTGATDADRRTALACAEQAVELSRRKGPVMLAALAGARFRLGDRAAAIAALDECRKVMAGRNAERLTLAEVIAKQRLYVGR